MTSSGFFGVRCGPADSAVRWRRRGVAAMLTAWLAGACATTEPGQSAQWGALIGGIVGGATGAMIHEDDRATGALVGAAAGALIGGATGYFIGKYREQQLAARSAVEQEHFRRTGERPGGPLVDIENVALPTTAVEPGRPFDVTTQFAAYGPGTLPPTVEYILRRGDQALFRKSVKAQHDGRVAATQEIAFPGDAPPGPYELEVVADNNGSKAKLTRSLVLRAVPDADEIRAIPDEDEIRRRPQGRP